MKLLFLGYLGALSNERRGQGAFVAAVEKARPVDEPPTLKAEEPYHRPKISRAQRYAWRKEKK